MKTMKQTGKKALSVFLAVLMVMTAWVFVAPTEAEAFSAETIKTINENALKGISGSTDINTTSGVYFAGDTEKGITSVPNVYQNLIWSGSAQQAAIITNQTIQDSKDVEQFAVYYPATVLMYDGVTTPQMGVSILKDSLNKSDSKYQVFHYGTKISSTTDLVIPGDWHTKNEETGSTNPKFYYTWNGGNNQAGLNYTGTRGGSYYAGGTGWHYISNLIQYNGSMGDTTYSATYKPSFETYLGRQWSSWGKTQYKEATYTLNCSVPIYVINAKPLKTAYTQATAVYSAIAANPSIYSTESVATFVTLANALLNANPNKYTWSSNTANVVSAYANAAKDAVDNWNTWKDSGGLTVTVDGVKYSSGLLKQNYTVHFDNMFDFNKFTIGGNLTVNERTNTGFTVTSTASDGNTGFSYAIPVEPGKTYTLSADVDFDGSAGGGGYDMYIHTLDANQSGETTATPDTSNGAHRESTYYISLTGQTTNTKPYITFTAGANTGYIKFRFDANNAGNKLTVNNIRFYEDNGTSYHESKSYPYGDAIGTLPTPTREHYDFVCWVDASGNTVSGTTTVTDDVLYFSKWTPKNYTITFKDGNGTIIYDKTFPYGSMPVFDTSYNDKLTKRYDEKYHYTPNYGWKPALTTVTGNKTYEATFDEVAHTYNSVGEGGYDEIYHLKYCSCGASTKEEHNLVYTRTYIEPTCVEYGSDVYTCTACKREVYKETEPLGHDFSGEYKSEPGGEGQYGAHYRKCIRCDVCGLDGENNKTEPHVWSEENSRVTTEPTCTATGVKTYYCTAEHEGKKCNGTYTVSVPKIEHSYSDVVSKVDPTCTATGMNAYKQCTSCKQYFKPDAAGLSTEGKADLITFVIGALGHEYEDTLTVDIKATCDAAGSKSKHCVRYDECKSTDDVTEIPARGHIFVDTTVEKEPTCKDFGVMNQKCVNEETDEYAACSHTTTRSIDKVDHVYTGSATSNGNGANDTHNVSCKWCDAYITESHKWDVSASAATCTQGGVENYSCSVCSATRQEAVPAKGHDYSGDYVMISDGQNGTHYRKCIRFDECKTHGLDTTESKTEGHLWDDGTVTTDPTCTTEGVRTYKCTGNGCTASYTEAVERIAHTYGEIVAKVEPKCETTGMEAYKQCTACNQFFAADADDKSTDGKANTDSFVIAVLGHEYEDTFTVDKKASCYVVGSKSKHCVRYEDCKSSIQVTDIPTRAHDIVDTTVETAATCFDDGVMNQKCANEETEEYEACTHTTTRVIPATGHVNVYAIKEKTVKSCGDYGYPAHYRCAACLKVYLKFDYETKQGSDEVEDLTDIGNENAVGKNGVPDVIEYRGEQHDFESGDEYVMTVNGKNGTHNKKCANCDDYDAASSHTFDMENPEVTAATCTAEGSKNYTCTAKGCVATYTETLPKAAHTIDEEEDKISAVAPTCSAPGNNEYYQCSVCDGYFKDAAGTTATTVKKETLAQLEHTWKEPHSGDVLVSEATCLSPAIYNKCCVICGGKYVGTGVTYTVGDPADHNYSGAIKDNEDGTHSYACINDCACGTYGVDKTEGAFENCSYETVAKNDLDTHKVICKCGAYTTVGHTWSDWKADTTGIGTEPGTMSRSCNICTETDTKECTYNKLGEVTAKCESEGSISYKCTEDNCAHVYVVITPVAGHNWKADNETFIKSAATCEADAVYYLYCEACNISSEGKTDETWTKTGSKLTHDWSEWEQVVTETDGVKEYNHTRTCKNNTTASCIEIGCCMGDGRNCVDKSKCEVCKKEFGTYGTNHKSPKLVEKDDSTCQKEGCEAYYICEACGFDMELKTPIPMKDHTYGAWVQVVTEVEGVTVYKHERVCTTCADGTEKAKESGDCSGGVANCTDKAKCDTCEKTYGDVDSTKHKSEEWTIKEDTVKPATCQSEGYTGDKYYVCCPTVKMADGEETPKLDHKFDIEVSRVDATCLEAGSVTYKCSTCVEEGEVKAATKAEDLSIDKTNHASDEFVLKGEKAVTCTTDGYTGDQHYKCCDALYRKGSTIKANGKHTYTNPVAEYLVDVVTTEEDGKVTKALVAKEETPTYDAKVAARHDDGKWYHVQICTVCYDIVYGACYTYEHTSNCTDTDICEVCDGLCSLKDPTTHKNELTYHEKQLPTCGATGTKAYYECEDCGNKYYDKTAQKPVAKDSDLVLDKTSDSHIIDEDSIVNNGDGTHSYDCEITGCAGVENEKCYGGSANCKEKAVCDVCATAHGELDPTVHAGDKETVIGASAETCSTPGYTGDRYYACCYKEDGSEEDNKNALIAKGEVIPADESAHVEVLTKKDDAQHTVICSACSNTLRTEDHVWDDGVKSGEGNCTTGYDMVYTCACTATKTVNVPAKGHDYKTTTTTVPATCTTPGSKTTTKTCSVCGDTATDTTTIAAPGHDLASSGGYGATCSKPGMTDRVYCKNCSYVESESREIPSTGCVDSNNDGYCDYCKEYLRENADGTNCGCICHKQNGFMKFIYSILRFFWKLFGISRTCCSEGVHY